MNESMDESMTEVCVEQPLALPGSAKKQPDRFSFMFEWSLTIYDEGISL